MYPNDALNQILLDIQTAYASGYEPGLDENGTACP